MNVDVHFSNVLEHLHGHMVHVAFNVNRPKKLIMKNFRQTSNLPLKPIFHQTFPFFAMANKSSANEM